MCPRPIGKCVRHAGKIRHRIYRPFAFEHLVHPATDAEGKVAYPFRVGLSNALAAMVPIGLAGTAYLIGYRELLERVAWWVWAAVPASVAAVTFGHAYLGAIIGGRRANNVFKVGLALVLVAGCWLLTQLTAT